MCVAGMRYLKGDAQTVTEKKQQGQGGRIKRTADKTSSRQAMTVGSSDRPHTKELPTLSPINGVRLAYSMGMKAGKKRDLTSNPQFLSYSERIAYRASGGAHNAKAANVELTGSAASSPIPG